MKYLESKYSNILRKKDFVYLWMAFVVGCFGAYVYRLALPWLVLDTTGSALKMSIITVIGAMASLCWGPIAGALVDRWHRKNVMIASDLMRGLVILSLLLFSRVGHLSLLPIYTVCFFVAFFSLLFDPARGAVIPQLVGKGSLITANAFLRITSGIIMLISMALGGQIAATMGYMSAMLLVGLSFLTSALLTMAIRIPMHPRRRSSFSFLGDITEGLKFIRSNLAIRQFMISRASSAFPTAIAMVLCPVFFKETLGVGVKEYGFFGAAIGLGSLIGAFVIGKISHLFTPGKWFSLGTLSLGVVLVLLPFTSALMIAFLLGGAIGFFNQPVFIPSDSFLQGGPPEEIRGRVLSTLSILSSVATLLGASLAGILADTFPILPVFLFCSIVYLGVGIASLFSKSMQEASI